MRAKSTLRLIPVLALTYAAGWFTHRSFEAPPPAPARTALTVAPGARGGAGMAAAAGQAAAPGGMDRQAETRPLQSLAEVLELLGKLDGDGEELAVLPLMDLLPRLMITDAATVGKMMEELAADTSLDRDADYYPVAVGGLAFRWMMLQPEAAAGFLLRHEKALGDFADMTPFFVAWADRARPGAGERLLGEVPEDDRENIGALLEMQVLLADPAKTLRDPAAAEKLDGDELKNLACRWEAADPAGFLAWRAGLPPEAEEREAADSAVLENLASLKKKDSASVDARLAALPPELAARVRLKFLSMEIRDQHHEAENPGQPAPAPAVLAARLAEVMASQEIPMGELRYTTSILGRAFVRDGEFEKAAQWSLTLPEKEDLRENAVRGFFGQWIESDSAAASTWLNTLPPGGMRDTSTVALIEAIRGEDPQKALIWARSMGNSEARRDAVQGVYREWFRSDPAAASQAVQALPPEELQSLKSEKRDPSVKLEEQQGGMIGGSIDYLLQQNGGAGSTFRQGSME